MQLLANLLLVIQIISALVMIGLVLIQHGKGADMGASFGSGSAGSLFGATGSATFLSRSTSACATVFFLSTLGLAYFGMPREAPSGGSSVLEKPTIPSGSAPGAIPGAIPGAPPVASGDVGKGSAPAPSPGSPSTPGAKPGEIPRP